MTMKIINRDNPTPDVVTIITIATESEKREIHILNEIATAGIHTLLISLSCF